MLTLGGTSLFFIPPTVAQGEWGTGGGGDRVIDTLKIFVLKGQIKTFCIKIVPSLLLLHYEITQPLTQDLSLLFLPPPSWNSLFFQSVCLRNRQKGIIRYTKESWASLLVKIRLPWRGMNIMLLKVVASQSQSPFQNLKKPRRGGVAFGITELMFQPE